MEEKKPREFKAKWVVGKDGKKHLVIEGQVEEREYIGKDGKKHKDTIVHAPSLKMISEFAKQQKPKEEEK